MIYILVAHRADARIFKSTGKPGSLKLVRALDHPEGRKQNREIDTDAKGSRYSATAGRGNGNHGSAPGSQMKHGLDPQLEAAEHIADQFAKELAEELRLSRSRGEYEELMLVAEPGFLGKLRLFLDKVTGACVSESINRNLTGLPTTVLTEQLEQLVHQSRKVA